MYGPPYDCKGTDEHLVAECGMLHSVAAFAERKAGHGNDRVWKATEPASQTTDIETAEILELLPQILQGLQLRSRSARTILVDRMMSLGRGRECCIACMANKYTCLLAEHEFRIDF